MFNKKKKTDEQIYRQGFAEGETSKEKQMKAAFEVEKQDVINYYDEQIAELNFEKSRLEIKFGAIKAENMKIQSDAVESKKRLSDAKKIEKRWDSIKNDFREALQQEEKIRMEPLQKIGKLIDSLENVKQIEQ